LDVLVKENAGVASRDALPEIASHGSVSGFVFELVLAVLVTVGLENHNTRLGTILLSLV
jgi:hypothetical protein